MEDTSEHVKLQLRVRDKIYESVVSSNAVAEVLMKGDQSNVAETISKNNAPVSSAMGAYTKLVEVLSVSPLAAEQLEGTEVQVVEGVAADPEFGDPQEMMKYVYNSCSASGRIGDGLDLVRSQKRHLAFDYKFATNEGAVLFNIHALDLQDEIQLMLYDLAKEKMPIWKQMRCLEIVAAIIAETLMEMSVKFYTSPEEIHWPMGCTTRPGAHAAVTKGKRLTKKQGGVFGQLVHEYGPKGPVVDAPPSNVSQSGGNKVKNTRSSKGKATQRPPDDDEASETGPVHEGLPVQERKYWTNDELADVLYLFRVIQLDPNYRNNYKELARRMQDSGWQRDNNQCRHQIDRMKRRYDAMVEQDKKSGGCLYVEILRRELNECFGALKDVTPDKVYSSRKGMLAGATLVPEAEEADNNINNNNSDAAASTSDAQPSTTKDKKKPKSRQPVVSMIESALTRCSADWKEQNTELNTKIDLMLQLQQQRLQLDRDRLEFEREMAGLGKTKAKSAKVPKTRKRKKASTAVESVGQVTQKPSQ